MAMELSSFGEKLANECGINELMDDLGRALSGSERKLMLGGGNPAHIPEVNEIWRRRMQEIVNAGGELDCMLANYDTPQGHLRFLDALAAMLSRELGWPVSAANIAVTNGSQSAFFLLFNMLAGRGRDGRCRRVVFPMMPEYIGYADQALERKTFIAERAAIERIDDHTFKYRVDFDALELGDDVAAICASRPTNPTGNVLTSGEVSRLAALAGERGIPLLLDNAYGNPFPGIIFEEAAPVWDENTIVVMSLSKLGLPSVRTGIVIARPEIIRALSSANAVLSLASGSVGQVLMLPLIENGEVLRLSREVIRPYYRRKRDHALACLHRALGAGADWAVHKSEGALFLWLWLRGLPITTRELYERLKRRHVVVVPSGYFFFGLREPWSHAEECLRLTYSQADGDVHEGIEIIADELRRL
jgi:valine--pyruvate aminotransferase